MINRLNQSDFDVLRDCYNSPDISEPNPEHTELNPDYTPKPPIHNPNYFQQQLDDQYQSGWVDGYCASEDHRPLRYWSVGLIGSVTGFLLYHVLTIIL